MPMAGEYSPTVLQTGLREFVARHIPALLPPPPAKVIPLEAIDEHVHARPPGLCTGCPERPVFAAMKLVAARAGRAPCQRRHRLPPVLDPAALRHRQHHHGLRARCGRRGGLQRASRHKRAISDHGRRRLLAQRPDQRHRAMPCSTSSDNLTVIVDNNYTAATGGQDILSSRAGNRTRSTCHPIEKAVRGVGVEWVRTIRPHLRRGRHERGLPRGADDDEQPGPKVIVAQSECMLNRQRREKPLVKKADRRGPSASCASASASTSDTCTGDHSCIRLSRLPVADASSRIRTRCAATRWPPCSTAASAAACAARSSHAAVLCPSFYRADIVSNPNALGPLHRRTARPASSAGLQRRRERRLAATAF